MKLHNFIIIEINKKINKLVNCSLNAIFHKRTKKENTII